jgi:hypothetical protein
MLPVLHLPQPGAVPHLRPNELLVLSEGGGQLGYEGRLTVQKDGIVTFTTRQRQQADSMKRRRLSTGELNALRFLIAQTDFQALHRQQRVQYGPSAVDGIDRGVAVRQGKAVRGWSNTIWAMPAHPVPLFTRLQDLMDR